MQIKKNLSRIGCELFNRKQVMEIDVLMVKLGVYDKRKRPIHYASDLPVYGTNAPVASVTLSTYCIENEYCVDVDSYYRLDRGVSTVSFEQFKTILMALLICSKSLKKSDIDNTV